MLKTKGDRNPVIFVLYFIPGTVYFIFNSLFARAITRMINGDLWVVQIYIASFVLCGLLLFVTWFYLRYFEKLSFRGNDLRTWSE